MSKTTKFVFFVFSFSLKLLWSISLPHNHIVQNLLSMYFPTLRLTLFHSRSCSQSRMSSERTKFGQRNFINKCHFHKNACVLHIFTIFIKEQKMDMISTNVITPHHYLVTNYHYLFLSVLPYPQLDLEYFGRSIRLVQPQRGLLFHEIPEI